MAFLFLFGLEKPPKDSKAPLKEALFRSFQRMDLPQTSSKAGKPEARHRLCATGPCHEGLRVSTAEGLGPGSILDTEATGKGS